LQSVEMLDMPGEMLRRWNIGSRLPFRAAPTDYSYLTRYGKACPPSASNLTANAFVHTDLRPCGPTSECHDREETHRLGGSRADFSSENSTVIGAPEADALT
jgi:hypothetical protein